MLAPSGLSVHDSTGPALNIIRYTSAPLTVRLMPSH